VLRDENDMILNGTIRYDIHHRPGTPYRITVPAMSQAEAEARVDEWIQEMRERRMIRWIWSRIMKWGWDYSRELHQ
jgi:hypothetical protein